MQWLQSDQSLFCAVRNFASYTIQNTPSEDSDQIVNSQADQNLH